MSKNFKILRFIVIFIIALYITNMKVDAYIPVTYRCCYNYTDNDGEQINNFENNTFRGTQLDNFENLSSWTVYDGFVEADNINFKEGNQGMKLIVINEPRIYLDKILNNTFAYTDNFAIWIYIPDVNTFSRLQIYFTSTGKTWSKYFYKSVYTGFKNGWNRIIIDKNSFSNYGNENWNNSMNRMRIAVYPIVGQNTNVTIDDLRYDIGNDWTGSSQEVDIINFKEGRQGLKLIATNGNYAYSDIIINKNFSDINNFALWIYVDNASNLYSIDILISSKPWENFFDDTVHGVRTGWNKIVLNKHSFQNYFNENWENVMTRMRLRIRPSVGKNLNVTFDDMRKNMRGSRAKLMIGFDDGIKNVYSNAYPILNSNNQHGIAYIVTSYDGPSVMNLTNLKTLQSSGWDISSHTVHHANLVDSDNSTQISELNDSYDWLVTNKFQKSAGFISYPNGAFNDIVLDNVEKRYILGRAAGSNLEGSQQHFSGNKNIQYIQRIIEVYDTTTVQSIKDNINDTINAKLLGILLFHGIVDSNPGRYDYLKTDLQAISNYIKSRIDDVDLITNSEYVIPIVNNYTPIINKLSRIYHNGSSIIITNNKYDDYMPNMTVRPSTGYIDILITTYNESGGHIKFNESSSIPSSNLSVSYDIGDRIPNILYSVKIYLDNGIKYNDFNVYANNTGFISYDLEGFENSRYQEIDIGQMIDTSFTVTLPVGYTFLKFNAPNATVANLDVEGQNDIQPIFNITNYGNINQNFIFNLNGTIPNIMTYADLDGNHMTGKIEINKSPTMIIPNLNPGSSQNVWMIVDTNRALVTNSNKTLTINNS